MEVGLALAIFTIIFLLLLIMGFLQPKLFTDREYWCYLGISFLLPISLFTLLFGKKRYELLGIFLTCLLFMGMGLLMYNDADYKETI